MNKSDLNEVFKLGCEDRYEYFLDGVIDSGEIWILVNDKQEFLKLFSEDHELEYLPIWPHEDFAREYGQDSDEVLTPKKITVADFFSRWVPGLQGDFLQVSVFPNFDETVWIMEPEDLQADLQGD